MQNQFLLHNSKCKNQSFLSLCFHVIDDIACYRSLEPWISAEDLLQQFLKTLWWSSNPFVFGLVPQAAGAARGGSVLVSCITFGNACSISQVRTWKATPFLSFRSGCQMLFVSCSSISGTAEVWGDHDFTCNLAGGSQGSFPLLAVWVWSAFSMCPICSASRILGKYFCFFHICFPVVLLNSVNIALLWDKGRMQGKQTTKLRGMRKT